MLELITPLCGYASLFFLSLNYDFKLYLNLYAFSGFELVGQAVVVIVKSSQI